MRPPLWRNPRKGRDTILPSGNLDNKDVKRGQDESRLGGSSNDVEDTNETDAATMIDLTQDPESSGTLHLHSNDDEAVQGDLVDQRLCFADNTASLKLLSLNQLLFYFCQIITSTSKIWLKVE